MDVDTSHRSRVSPIASTRRNRGDANRSRASINASEASVSHPVNDNLAYLLVEGVEAEKGPILGAPEDLSLLVGFNTYVVAAIWNGRVL